MLIHSSVLNDMQFNTLALSLQSTLCHSFSLSLSLSLSLSVTHFFLLKTRLLHPQSHSIFLPQSSISFTHTSTLSISLLVNFIFPPYYYSSSFLHFFLLYTLCLIHSRTHYLSPSVFTPSFSLIFALSLFHSYIHSLFHSYVHSLPLSYLLSLHLN